MTEDEINALLDRPGVLNVALSTDMRGKDRTTLVLQGRHDDLVVDTHDYAAVKRVLDDTLHREQERALGRHIVEAHGTQQHGAQTNAPEERTAKLHLLVTLLASRACLSRNAMRLLRLVADDLGYPPHELPASADMAFDQACGELRVLLYPPDRSPEPEPTAVRVTHSVGRELEFEEERMALEDMRERRAAGEPK